MKTPEQVRQTHTDACRRWQDKNRERLRVYRKRYLAKQIEEEQEPDIERMRRVAKRLLAKAAKLAEAKTNGRGYAGQIKPRGI